MTSEDIQNAEEIVREWFWQPDSWHRKSVVRYYESAPIQPDVLQLVVAYLKQQETDRLFILNKELPLGETWKATDAWFQTSPSDKWAGTESTKIRIYQAFKPKADESDGPYTVENGCKYLVTHEFHWDVAAIPTLPASSSGINYTLQGVTRDKETGLYSCVIEKRETVQQDVPLYDTAMTIFEHIQEELHLGVKESNLPTTGQAASVGGGTIVERRVTKNPDCTSDVQNKVTVEDPVSGSVKQYRKTLRGTVETTTDRNQTTPLGSSSMKVGETRRSEKTPGGLYNNTTEAVTTEAAGEIAKDCQKTIFEHTDETLTNQLAEPASKEASAAGSGKTYRKTTRKNEEGTFDVTERETTENPVSESVKQYRKTLRGTVETTVDRNQTTALSGSSMKVGETRRSEKTPGGLYNNTTETVTIDTNVHKIANGCQKTSSVHTDTKVESVPVEQEEYEHVTEEVNKEKEVSYRRNDDGATKDKTTVTRTWALEEKTKTWSDSNYDYTYYTYRNATEPVVPSEGEIVSASFTHNGHGSFDGNYLVKTSKTAGNGSALAWSIGPKNITAKYYYFNKEGKLCHRLFSGTVKKVYGRSNHVANELYGQNVTPAYLPQVGWVTHMGDGLFTHGTLYTLTSVGAEVVDDSDSQAQS